VLARANRLIRAEEFRRVVRRGRRSATASAVYYRYATSETEPARFGFIVSRAVGGAVERNLLRRRLRAISRSLVEQGAHGSDVVVRALPGCAERRFAEWEDELRSELGRRLGSAAS